MKHSIQLITFVAWMAFSCKPPAPVTDLTKEILIPKPVSVTSTGTSFIFNEEIPVYFSGNREIKALAIALANQYSIPEGMVEEIASPPAKGIFLSIAGKDATG